MKKLPFYISIIAILILATLTSFSTKENNAPVFVPDPVMTDTALLPLDSMTAFFVDQGAEFTLCTADACLLVTLPELLPGEAVIPGQAYTVCTSEECFLAIVAENQNDTSMLVLVLEDKSHL